MTVFDSSALLAFLKREPGGALVAARLEAGGSISAANWSEVAQKSNVGTSRWPASRAVLLSYGLVVEPVTGADAELAAELWANGKTLSLADRLCLALGARLDDDILTADRAWDGRAGVVVLR